MEIHQFDDRALAHYSYAILESDQMVVIDPARKVEPYLKLAEDRKLQITHILETHPHADFVSGHAELAQRTGASIYIGHKVGADYPHRALKQGDTLKIGALTIRAYETPGHSPDSLTFHFSDGERSAVFTGDTLFIGDCGRPDLRESSGNIKAKARELAVQMYHSLREVYSQFEDDCIVYPAHGAGSLCGKGMSDANSSTMKQERMSNWSLSDMGESEFVEELLSNQPFVPKYFPHAVEINKKGAVSLKEGLAHFGPLENPNLDELIVIDTRPEAEFKKGHTPGAINLMEGAKFETWLGSILSPDEPFVLRVNDSETAVRLAERVAKIGYEGQLKGYFTQADQQTTDIVGMSAEHLKDQAERYTIVDIRNPSEFEEGRFLEHAVNIPLYELRERSSELEGKGEVVIHCAAGYRSAAGASIVQAALKNQQVYDLGTEINSFK